MLEIYLETKPDIGHSQIRTMVAGRGSHVLKRSPAVGQNIYRIGFICNNGHHLYLINTESQLDIHSQYNGMCIHCYLFTRPVLMVHSNAKV